MVIAWSWIPYIFCCLDYKIVRRYELIIKYQDFRTFSMKNNIKQNKLLIRTVLQGLFIICMNGGI